MQSDKCGVWTEVYRPKEWEEVINLPSQIPTFTLETLPNLLFAGSPGTGKTTVARILISKLGAEHLDLNASDERGIETVREKVKGFAASKSMNGKQKIVFLDEMDGLTPEAQQSLRNTIEQYNHNCKFIGSANYLNKIIDPIKSRFSLIEFRNPSKEQIENRLKYICQKEEIIVTDVKWLKMIVDNTYPDIRAAIGVLQISVCNKQLSGIKTTQNVAKEIWSLIRQKNFTAVREMLVKDSVDIDSLVVDMEDLIFFDTTIPEDVRMKIIILLADSCKVLPFVVLKRIEFEWFVLKVLELFK